LLLRIVHAVRGEAQLLVDRGWDHRRRRAHDQVKLWIRRGAIGVVLVDPSFGDPIFLQEQIAETAW
jgi:hypothetical protein